MCGIVAVRNVFAISDYDLVKICQSVEDRGKDAWGCTFLNPAENAETIFKSTSSFSQVRAKLKLLGLLKSNRSSRKVDFLFHCRLATSGLSGMQAHNHPIKSGKVMMIFNGLVTDFGSHVDIELSHEKPDSLQLAELIETFSDKGLETILQEIEGEITLVFKTEDSEHLYYFTNVGNLYIYKNDHTKLVVSEPLPKNIVSKLNLKESLTLVSRIEAV